MDPLRPAGYPADWWRADTRSAVDGFLRRGQGSPEEEHARVLALVDALIMRAPTLVFAVVKDLDGYGGG